MPENVREYFRILYPLDEQPILTIDGARYRVRDCSERGLAFRARDGRFAPDEELRGRVEFMSGSKVDVSGRVVRHVDDLVAVKLTDDTIPFAVILAEQRRLHAQGRLL